MAVETGLPVKRAGVDRPVLPSRELDGVRESIADISAYITARASSSTELNIPKLDHLRGVASWSCYISDHRGNAQRLLGFVDKYYGPLEDLDEESINNCKIAANIFKEQLWKSSLRYLFSETSDSRIRSFSARDVLMLITYGIAQELELEEVAGNEKLLGDALALAFNLPSIGAFASEFQERTSYQLMARFIRSPFTINDPQNVALAA